MVAYLLQLAAWIVFMAVLIFVPAGTLLYPGGGAFIGLFAASGLGMVLWLARASPSLLRERMALPLQRGQKRWDRFWLSGFVLAFFAWLAFMSWDAARAGFAAVPAWLQAIGGLLILVNMAGTWWTFRENAFAAP